MAGLLLLVGLVPAPVGAADRSDTSLPLGVSKEALGAPSKGVLVATGDLRTSKGARTGGRVAALLWPSEKTLTSMKAGAEFSTPTVGWAKVSPQGKFRLHVIPSKVPAGYVAPNGQLDIMLRAWDGTEEQSWSISTGNGVAMDSKPTADEPYGKAKTHLHIKLRQKQTDGMSQVRSASGDQVSPMTLPAPTYVGCSWVLNDTIDQSAVDNVPFYTYNDKAKVEFGSSKSVSVGGAISGGGAFANFEYSGSTSKSQGVTYEMTSFTADERIYRIQMRWGTYKEVCQSSSGPYILRWAYEPYQATGGYSYQTVSYNWFTCSGGGQNVPGPATWSRTNSSGNATSYSVGAHTSSFIGIDLPFKATYNESSTSDRLVRYNTTRNSMHLCGNNDDPSLASLVREGPATKP